MPYETIDKVFDQLWEDNGFSICICGGECMLHPERVAYVCKKAKEKHLPTIIGTNGYWWNNKEILQKVKNEIKPTFLRISVDKFHQKFLPVNKLEKLIHYFDDSEIRIFGGTIWRYECESKDRKWFDNSGLIYESMACVMHGNAGLLPRTEELYPGDTVSCEACGIVVAPNGDLYIECEMELFGCKIGSIFDKDCSFKDIILNKFVNYKKPFYTVKEGQHVHDIYDLCRANNDFIFDEKWNDTPGKIDLTTKDRSNIYVKTVAQDNNYFKRIFKCLVPLSN